ncbi:phage tail assembly protein [Oricola indica]|jgi:uncharacterized protein YunC (DUF1805 family)|uniref:phage tail assembly protein n=1 Tax=Oricola indica TaxID=2872591 RepID=UPI001CBBD8CD|nr:phage tail assembly protein [Oricola indica]
MSDTAKRPKTAKHTLIEPVEVDGKTYTELTFRRMKAKDALVGENETNPVRAGYLIFAALADVPVEVIEELDMEDLEAVGEVAAPLMGKSAAAMARDAKEKALQSAGAT